MRKILFVQKNEKLSLRKKIINISLLLLIIFSLFLLAINKIDLNLNFIVLKNFKSQLLKGFFMTVSISLATFIVSSLIAILNIYFYYSKIVILNYLSKFYIDCIRGTPLLMQIYLFYYIIGSALKIENRFIAGVIILSLFEGAYISEIFRGSLESFDKGQLEIARSIGYSKIQTFRYIIFPQLLSRTLPALTGQFASIIKDSSLLSVIAIVELTQSVREISSINFRLFECYIFLGILYLLLTLPLKIISEKLEKVWC